jgi:hypothetical protein
VVALIDVKAKVELETSRPAYCIIYVGYREGSFEGCRVDAAAVSTFSDFVSLFDVDYRGGHSFRTSRSCEDAF